MARKPGPRVGCVVEGKGKGKGGLFGVHLVIDDKKTVGRLSRVNTVPLALLPLPPLHSVVVFGSKGRSLPSFGLANAPSQRLSTGSKKHILPGQLSPRYSLLCVS